MAVVKNWSRLRGIISRLKSRSFLGAGVWGGGVKIMKQTKPKSEVIVKNRGGGLTVYTIVNSVCVRVKFMKQTKKHKGGKNKTNKSCYRFGNKVRGRGGGGGKIHETTKTQIESVG